MKKIVVFGAFIFFAIGLITSYGMVHELTHLLHQKLSGTEGEFDNICFLGYYQVDEGILNSGGGWLQVTRDAENHAKYYSQHPELIAYTVSTIYFVTMVLLFEKAYRRREEKMEEVKQNCIDCKNFSGYHLEDMHSAFYCKKNGQKLQTGVDLRNKAKDCNDFNPVTVNLEEESEESFEELVEED